MPKVNLNTDVEDASSVRLPKNNYTLRCTDAYVKVSQSKGVPMVQMTWEIVAPSSIQQKQADGSFKEIDPRGIEIRHYLSTSPGGLQWQLKPMHKALGLPMDVDTDALNPEIYKGLFLDAICASEAGPEMSESGEPLTDENGSAIIRYQHRIERPIKKGKPVDNMPY